MKSITLSTFIPSALLLCIGMAGVPFSAVAGITCDSAAEEAGFCRRNTESARLEQDEMLVSPNGAYFGLLQQDCNFVVYNYPADLSRLNGERHFPIWATNTAGKSNCRLTFQKDGNLVLYSGNNPEWSSATHGSGNNLSMFLQNDGNLVIYKGDAPDSTQAIWSSHGQGCQNYNSHWCATTGAERDKYRRLALQHRLDYEVPLSQITVVSSHNTYNSKDWGYPYPNHRRDLIDQLNAGIRGVNYDVHTVNSFETLCHFQGTSSFTCRVPETDPIYDEYPELDPPKSFAYGLQQLNNWLDAHPDEVVILVLEDYIDQSRHDEATQAIKDNIRSKVYRPALTGSCQRLPLATLTKQQVLDAGKQLIITSAEDCDHTHSGWRKWVWDVNSKHYKGNKYKKADLTRRDDRWSFVYEDRSVVGVFSNNLSGDEVAEVMRKGAGVIALDMILKENRHDKAIWSWKADEPNSDSGKNCAVQSSNSKWQALKCYRTYRHACQDPESGDWALSASAGAWKNGDSACQSLGNYIFSMPVNAGENASLNAVRTQAGVDYVWLNYTDQIEEGRWVATHRWNSELDF